jgi:hypothetical protein
VDWQACTQKVGKEIEALLQQQDLKGTWDAHKAWYKHAGDHPTKPSHQDLESLTTEWKALYSYVPSPGAPLPIHVNPFPVLDIAPLEEEVATAVWKLCSGKAPGPSGLKAKDLKS